MFQNLLFRHRSVTVMAAIVLLVGADVLGWQATAAVHESHGEGSSVPGEDSLPSSTRDDKLLAIAEEVPGFGGVYVDPDQQEVLYVYLQNPDDTEQVTLVQELIEEKFPGTVPESGIQAIQGDYSIIQLNMWYDDLRSALAATDLMEEGLSMTDMEEDKNLLEVGVESNEYVSAVQKAVAEAGVPVEVVRITVRPRFQGLPTLRD